MTGIAENGSKENEISGLSTSSPSQTGQNVEGDAANTETFYQVLNLPYGASKMAIREGYLRLKNTLNGDNTALYSLMGADDVRAQVELVEHAFRVLNDETTRADYDRQLSSRRRRKGAGQYSEFNSELSSELSSDLSPELSGGWDVPRGVQVITTSRSTLPVIKTVCEGSKDASAQSEVDALVTEGDLGDGELFRRIRELMNVSEHEMQERTKISLEYLRSMESNRFDRLPQVVYVKGFLRSYFRYLGVDTFEPMVKAFSARLEAWQSAKKR